MYDNNTELIKTMLNDIELKLKSLFTIKKIGPTNSSRFSDLHFSNSTRKNELNYYDFDTKKQELNYNLDKNPYIYSTFSTTNSKITSDKV